MKKLVGILATTLVITLLAIPIVVSLIAGNYISRFINSSGLTFNYFYSTAKEVLSNYPPTSTTRFNTLIMGLDKRDDQFESTTLTDSIIFASFVPNQATATLISLPRDLWLPDLKTKINSLYYYGLQNGQGISFVTNNVTKLTNQPVNHYLLLDYSKLSQIIDALGGIDLFVENSFTDPTYPNPSYLTNPNAPIYITISFAAGQAHMDGNTALQFVRSRTSPDPLESGDGARSKRQLLVIQAMLKKLIEPSFLRNPTAVGNTYKLMRSSVETNLSDSKLILLALATYPNTKITLNSKPISTSSDSKDPILINPPISKYGQWVWELKDQSGKQLKEFFVNALSQ